MLDDTSSFHTSFVALATRSAALSQQMPEDGNPRRSLRTRPTCPKCIPREDLHNLYTQKIFREDQKMARPQDHVLGLAPRIRSPLVFLPHCSSAELAPTTPLMKRSIDPFMKS